MTIIFVPLENEIEKNLLDEALQAFSMEYVITKISEVLRVINETSNPILLVDSHHMLDDSWLFDLGEIALFAYGHKEAPKSVQQRIEQFYPVPFKLGQIIQDLNNYQQHIEAQKNLKEIKLGDMLIVPSKRLLRNIPANKEVYITDKELDILIYLSQSSKSVGKKELLQNIWQYADNVETHTLETHIYRLRQKIMTHLGCDNFLETNDDGYYLNYES